MLGFPLVSQTFTFKIDMDGCHLNFQCESYKIRCDIYVAWKTEFLILVLLFLVFMSFVCTVAPKSISLVHSLLLNLDLKTGLNFNLQAWSSICRPETWFVAQFTARFEAWLVVQRVAQFVAQFEVQFVVSFKACADLQCSSGPAQFCSRAGRWGQPCIHNIMYVLQIQVTPTYLYNTHENWGKWLSYMLEQLDGGYLKLNTLQSIGIVIQYFVHMSKLVRE